MASFQEQGQEVRVYDSNDRLRMIIEEDGLLEEVTIEDIDTPGGVVSVSAANSTIVVGGSATDPTIGAGVIVAPETVAATAKTTPVDADVFPIADSAASNALKKLSWVNVKATLKTYFDTLYPTVATPAIVLGSSAAAGSASTTVRSDGTIAAFDTTVPSTQAFGDAAAIGTAAFAARRDHQHAMPGVGTIGGVVWTTIVKQSDESVASSTTVQADDELFFATVNGAVYEIEAFIAYVSTAGGATPDIKYALGEDGTTRGTYTAIGLNTADAAGAANFVASSGVTAAGGTATTLRAVLAIGVAFGAGGTFTFWWAQNTSGVNATTVKAGSILRYRRIV